MSNAFDAYRDSYDAAVASSISFSGLTYDFFLAAKIDVLRTVFAAHFGPGARPTVLDVGCGVGLMHRGLSPLVERLAGTDISSAELDRASKDNGDVEYRLTIGRRVPWEDRSFDCALAVCVLHHVPPAEWRDFVDEMRRLVKPGGLVLLIDHNPWNPLTRLAVARCPFDGDAVLLSARRGRALLSEAGCRAVQSRHFLLLPSRHPIARKLEAAAKASPLGAQYLVSGIA